MKKAKKKIYIRTFTFSDGTKETVEGSGKDMMGPRYRGKWARKKYKKDKIKETKDSVRFE